MEAGSRPALRGDQTARFSPTRTIMDTQEIKDYFTGLQARIVGALEAFDGKPFATDA